MLNFNQLDIDIENAKKQHVDSILPIVVKRVINTGNSAFYQFLLFDATDPTVLDIRTEIKNILEADITQLFEWGGKWDRYVQEKICQTDTVDYQSKKTSYLSSKIKNRPSFVFHEFFETTNKLFSYDGFGGVNYTTYTLTENLKVRTCLYCNRQYAITHKKRNGGRLMNPQLDHWLPQSKYPLLQLSFYNLIPSCDICNSRVKNAVEFDPVNHVHPYGRNYNSFKFSYVYDNSLNNYKVIFKEPNLVAQKEIDTFKFLFIDEMYNAHISELKDLIRIEEIYGKSYLDNLEHAFPALGIKKEERYKLAFGVELDPKKFHLNPLSKFKYDILKELGIIS